MVRGDDTLARAHWIAKEEPLEAAAAAADVSSLFKEVH